jgi:hypothetical protein
MPNDPEKHLVHDAIKEISEYIPRRELNHMEINVHHNDDPDIPITQAYATELLGIFIDPQVASHAIFNTREFVGTDGEIDLLLFDGEFNSGFMNDFLTVLENWDPGEDYILFTNWDDANRLISGGLEQWDTGAPLGAYIGIAGRSEVWSHLVVEGGPFTQADIDQMVLPFDGVLTFENPF